MTAPSIVRTFLSYRWTLLAIGGLTFLLLAAATFVLVKPLATIRSAIDIGSVSVNGKDELMETPDLVAKRIPAVYAPLALSEMRKNGVPATTLSALQNSTAESIGRTVTIQSIVDPGTETDTKRFQQNVLDRIIDEQKRRSNFVRESAAARTVLAKKSADDLDHRITDGLKASDDLGALSNELRDSLHTQRDDLAAEKARTSRQPSTSSVDDAKGLRELVSAQLNVLAQLTVERAEIVSDLMAARTERAMHESALAEAQLSLRSITETHVSFAPEIVATTGKSRQLGFLFIAAVASILVTVAAAALLQNFVGTQT